MNQVQENHGEVEGVAIYSPNGQPHLIAGETIDHVGMISGPHGLVVGQSIGLKDGRTIQIFGAMGLAVTYKKPSEIMIANSMIPPGLMG